jgi:hypothetical protein
MDPCDFLSVLHRNANIQLLFHYSIACITIESVFLIHVILPLVQFWNIFTFSNFRNNNINVRFRRRHPQSAKKGNLF